MNSPAKVPAMVYKRVCPAAGVRELEIKYIGIVKLTIRFLPGSELQSSLSFRTNCNLVVGHISKRCE
jgi:hypothetical protein